jgi:ribosomal protein L12E/L44/L45/RPP1/RPP2
MHGPTCIVWVNLRPFSLQGAAKAAAEEAEAEEEREEERRRGEGLGDRALAQIEQDLLEQAGQPLDEAVCLQDLSAQGADRESCNEALLKNCLESKNIWKFVQRPGSS